MSDKLDFQILKCTLVLFGNQITISWNLKKTIHFPNNRSYLLSYADSSIRKQMKTVAKAEGLCNSPYQFFLHLEVEVIPTHPVGIVFSPSGIEKSIMETMESLIDDHYTNLL